MTIVHTDPDYLAHHGILGMKWGIRRYQNEDGSLTPAGLRRRQSEAYKQAQAKARAKTAQTRAQAKIDAMNAKNAVRLQKQALKAQNNQVKKAVKEQKQAAKDQKNQKVEGAVYKPSQSSQDVRKSDLRLMTDSELQAALNRAKNEKELRNLLQEQKSPLKRALATAGEKVLTAAVVGGTFVVARELLNKVSNSNLGDVVLSAGGQNVKAIISNKESDSYDDSQPKLSRQEMRLARINQKTEMYKAQTAAKTAKYNAKNAKEQAREDRETARMKTESDRAKNESDRAKYEYDTLSNRQKTAELQKAQDEKRRQEAEDKRKADSDKEQERINARNARRDEAYQRQQQRREQSQNLRFERRKQDEQLKFEREQNRLQLQQQRQALLPPASSSNSQKNTFFGGYQGKHTANNSSRGAHEGGYTSLFGGSQGKHTASQNRVARETLNEHAQKNVNEFRAMNERGSAAVAKAESQDPYIADLYRRYGL